MTATSTDDLVTRYVALWTQSNQSARRRAVEDFWTVDGVEHTGANQYRGHDAVARRVTAAYEQFFETGPNTLKLADSRVVVDDALIVSVNGDESISDVWTSSAVDLNWCYQIV